MFYVYQVVTLLFSEWMFIGMHSTEKKSYLMFKFCRPLLQILQFLCEKFKFLTLSCIVIY